MTLTWCSVHALKNKVLLKTPSGLLVLRNEMHIHNNIYALVFMNYMSLYRQCSRDWQNNQPGVMFRFISFTYSPTTDPFRTTKQQKPLLLWQTSSCHGSRLLSLRRARGESLDCSEKMLFQWQEKSSEASYANVCAVSIRYFLEGMNHGGRLLSEKRKWNFSSREDFF